MQAQTTAKLSAAVPGLLSRVFVDRGDLVRAGQVVAQLEAEVEEASVAFARTKAENEALLQSNRARVGFLQRKFARQEKLGSQKIVTEATLDVTETDMRVAEANATDAKYNLELAAQELKRAETQLAQRRIVSPFDGIVLERLLSPGEYRNEQSQILTIAKIDPLNFEVFAPVAFYGQTRLSATAKVMPEQPVGGEYTATVVVVDRVLDASSGTFGIRLKLDNPGNVLPAGLRCKILFAAVPSTPAAATNAAQSSAKPPPDTGFGALNLSIRPAP